MLRTNCCNESGCSVCIVIRMRWLVRPTVQVVLWRRSYRITGFMRSPLKSQRAVFFVMLYLWECGSRYCSQARYCRGLPCGIVCAVFLSIAGDSLRGCKYPCGDAVVGGVILVAWWSPVRADKL